MKNTILAATLAKRCRQVLLGSTASVVLLAAPQLAWAQAADQAAAPATEVSPQDDASKPLSDPTVGSDIVVTGTSIRGTAPVGSNLISVGRAAIEKTGAANTSEMLSTIPQLNSFNMIPEAQVLRSRTQGYALNIHNLGYYATLTLINGHRYAPSGGEVTFVDPAMIPSIGIERVELVPDGASGIYGSDAVAGVVNFVYRRPFTGIEANVQYGFGIGSLQSTQIGVIAGQKWDTGSLSLAVEYSRRIPPKFGSLGLTGNHVADGKKDLRGNSCTPGTVTAGTTAYQLPNFTPGRNLCDANPNSQLYPDGSRYTALLQGRKQLSDRAEAYIEGNFGYYRSKQISGYSNINVVVPRTNPYFQAPAGFTGDSVTVTRGSGGLFPDRVATGREKQYGATVGLDYKLSDAWQANFFTHYSQDENFSTPYALNPVSAQILANNTTKATAFNPFGSAADNDPKVLSQIDDGYYTRNWAKNRLLEIGVKADGPLFNIPGGPVKAAVGLDYRYEDVSQIQDYGARDLATVAVRDSLVDRNVYALFGELSVPLVGADNAMTLVRSLQLSLSARHDRYSGLKGITNPKIGVTWKPIDDLTLQGSWGKSFVAPNLGALGGSYLIPFPNNNQTAAGLGIINLVHVAGGNANLTPEYAETYSLGGKYAPSYIPGLRIGLSYFHVNYRDTQYQPQEGLLIPAFADFLRAKFPPGVVIGQTVPGGYATVANTIQSLLNDYHYKFQGLFPPGTVWQDITTSALVNAGVLKARGFDFDVNYTVQTGIGNFDLGVNGTRMTTYKFQLLPTIAPVEQLDTDRAPRWKTRSALNWAYQGVSANFVWNYISSYRNFAVTPNERVKALSTFDLRLAYEVPVLNGVEVSIRAQNLFNTDPPYYANANGYDAAAASPTGRQWQLGMRARF